MQDCWAHANLEPITSTLVVVSLFLGVQVWVASLEARVDQWLNRVSMYILKLSK